MVLFPDRGTGAKKVSNGRNDLRGHSRSLVLVPLDTR